MNSIKIFDCTIVTKKNLKSLIQAKKIFGTSTQVNKLLI